MSLGYDEEYYAVGNARDFSLSHPLEFNDWRPQCVGRQVMIDLQVKIPEGSDYGYYMTDYGIRTEDEHLVEPNSIISDYQCNYHADSDLYYVSMNITNTQNEDLIINSELVNENNLFFLVNDMIIDPNPGCGTEVLRPNESTVCDRIGHESEANALGAGVNRVHVVRSPNITETVEVECSSENNVDVVFYVRSKCPYSAQVIDAIAPVMETMGDVVDLQIDYIVQAVPPGQFNSLYGQQGVNGNIIQLCAMEHEPDNYMDFLVCMNEDVRSIPDNWEVCAEREGLNKELLNNCYYGDEGRQLLSESARRTDEAGVRASPTIFIAGEPYWGDRNSVSFQRTICRHTTHPACESVPMCGSDFECPADAGQIPVCINPNEANARCEQQDPIEFEVTVLTDINCNYCDTSQIVQDIQRVFIEAQVRTVDAGSVEGQTLIAELGITVAPAFIFDPAVKESSAWNQNPQIAGAFEEVGNYLKLRDDVTGASFIIDPEERRRVYESIGLIFDDNTPQIDFFVMSFCPYGNQVEEILEQVFYNLGDAVEFNPHYVLYSNYNGGGPDFCFDDESQYCSMHGIIEVNQNIRELCVNEHLGVGAWFDFASAINANCNVQNADACWEAVADDLGIDKSIVTNCFENEALDLLEKELRLNRILNVRGSPTIFIEGERFEVERSVPGFTEALCGAFENQPDECDFMLVNDSSHAPDESEDLCKGMATIVDDELISMQHIEEVFSRIPSSCEEHVTMSDILNRKINED
jgi:glutaredoxin